MTKNQSTKAISRSDWMRVVSSWAKAGSPGSPLKRGRRRQTRAPASRPQPARGSVRADGSGASPAAPTALPAAGPPVSALGEVDAEGVGIPYRSGGGEISAGPWLRRGFGLMIVSDGEGQAAQFAAHGAQLGQRGAHAGAGSRGFRAGAPALASRSVGSSIERRADSVSRCCAAASMRGGECRRDPGADGRSSSDALSSRAAARQPIRHKAGLPQSLFVDHRHLSRHRPTSLSGNWLPASRTSPHIGRPAPSVADAFLPPPDGRPPALRCDRPCARWRSDAR